jgi:hypothetical protein
MREYQLMPKELQSVFKQIENVMATPSLLYGRLDQEFEEDPDVLRFAPRNDVALPIPVYDVERAHAKGMIFDVTENGLGAKGIETNVDQVHSFAVEANVFFPINQFYLEAKCRWVNPAGTEKGYIAGFEITAISEENKQELHKFIQSINLVNRPSVPFTEGSPSKEASESSNTGSTVFRCPFCGAPYEQPFDECPQCGIIVSKYMVKLEEMATNLRKNLFGDYTAAEGVCSEPQEKSHGYSSEKCSERSFMISEKIWKDLKILGCASSEHVNQALYHYAAKMKVRRLK